MASDDQGALSVPQMFHVLLEQNGVLSTKLDQLRDSVNQRFSDHGERLTRVEGDIATLKEDRKRGADSLHIRIQNWIYAFTGLLVLAGLIYQIVHG